MRTCLYEEHLALGAKMVLFNDWEMPLQYVGIIQEHRTVREKVGLFDVSHMGLVRITGEQAEAFLDYLSTNKIAGKPDFSVTYTLWCHENGGCVDDLLVYRENSHSFLVVVNAGNRNKDLNHLKKQSPFFNVTLQDCFQDGILSLQGAHADALIHEFFPDLDLQKMHFQVVDGMFLSRTGYTGSDGYELLASSDLIRKWWKKFLEKGKEYGILPIGLGARDTLRLEMGYALYGHELSEEIAANETVSSWTIRWQKEKFLGKESLVKPRKRSEHGIVLLEKGIAREGYSVIKGTKKIGVVTSGTFSPSLNQAIAIILIEGEASPGDRVDVQIRDYLVPAEVVSLPFYQGS